MIKIYRRGMNSPEIKRSSLNQGESVALVRTFPSPASVFASALSAGAAGAAAPASWWIERTEPERVYLYRWAYQTIKHPMGFTTVFACFKAAFSSVGAVVAAAFQFNVCKIEKETSPKSSFSTLCPLGRMSS